MAEQSRLETQFEDTKRLMDAALWGGGGGGGEGCP